MWRVDAAAVEQIAIGAGILGTGGGGNPYLGKTHLLRLLREGAAEPVVVAPGEVPDDAVVASVGGMGAPTVGIERLSRGDEWTVALRALEAHTGRRVEYLVPGEIGGSNSTRPLVCAIQTGLPVVDGDGMGRAFPELQMDTFSIYGVKCTPAGLADIRHNSVVFADLADTVTLERYARAVTVQMGGHAGYAFPLMSGADLKRTVVPDTLSLARAVGAAVEEARRAHADPVAAVLGVTGGEVLFGGKVVDVGRRMAAGFARGSLRIDGLGDWRGATLAIDFQNENLIARRDGAVVAVVPDLICLVDAATAAPVTTEVVRYGLRVAVLGIPAPPLLTTPEALAVVGPRAFGYDVEYEDSGLRTEDSVGSVPRACRMANRVPGEHSVLSPSRVERAVSVAAAIEANQFAFLQYFGRGPGGEVQELSDMIRTASGIPHGMFNVVMGAHFAPGDADERIAATLDYYRGLGLPVSWLVSPSTRPADLGARLVAHGLRHLFDDPWMALDLAALNEDQSAPPAGFSIREVADLADLRLYDEAATRGFGQDAVLSKGFFNIYAHVGFGRDRPLRHFVGLLDGRAVAASTLCLGGGAAGIFGVATAPEARRRGIGTAMTLGPLREARALGYRLAGLQASEEGHGIYARLGFRDICTVSWYASPDGGGEVG